MHKIQSMLARVAGGSALLALGPWAGPSAAATPALERDGAAGITLQQTLCRKDGGQLWGHTLCGPVMLVDPATRQILTNQDTPDHALRPAGAFFEGVLTPDVGIANTDVVWKGRHWAMIQVPLPADPGARAVLLMHESYHRIQDEVLSRTNAAMPEHLDTMEGRISLRLEWRALAKALAVQGAAQRAAIINALAYRQWRHERFPDAAATENPLLLNEGLAEYTGRRLAGLADAEGDTIKFIAGFEQRPSYVRSFAYPTGPAYGLLLDRWAPDWRKGLTPASDLGTLLWGAIGHPALPAAATVWNQDGYAPVAAEEKTRNEARIAAAARWRALLVDAPHTTLPLVHKNLVFNPNTLFTLPPHGMVYPTLEVRDDWGLLKVSAGALLSPDWSRLALPGRPVVQGNEARGEGWVVTLNPGWTFADGADGARLVPATVAPSKGR